MPDGTQGAGRAARLREWTELETPRRAKTGGTNFVAAQATIARDLGAADFAAVLRLIREGEAAWPIDFATAAARLLGDPPVAVEAATSAPRSKLEHALAHAAAGFWVFPWRPRWDAQKSEWRKQPMVAWKTWATRDATTIRQWWGAHPEHNIGALTGRFGDNGAALYVIDIDVKNGGRGEETMHRLQAGGREFPRTLMAGTASGGRHFYYDSAGPLKQGTDIFQDEVGKGSGIDSRSGGGWIAMPGSTGHNGKTYVVLDDAPMADVPTWLADRAGTHREATLATNKPLAGIDADDAERRATEWVGEHAPRDVPQGGRNDVAFKVAAQIYDFGCDLPTAEMLLSQWNAERCLPPLSNEEICEVAKSARRSRQKPIGALSPSAAFGVAEVDDGAKATTHPNDRTDWLDETNREWFVAPDGGKVDVFRSSFDPELGRNWLERFRFEDFKRLHSNRVVTVVTDHGKTHSKPKGDAWLEHPRRRQYVGGIKFAPGRTVPPSAYNLWRGFAVEQHRGDWSLMRQHIRDVICSGDAKLDRYVMGWLASSVQKLDQPGQVALVLRGAKGSGKGILCNAMVRLFGQHGMATAQPEHVVGRFNSHLRDCCLLFVDEGFFAGDKRNEGALKRLITDDTLTFEAKHQNPITAPNYLTVLIASNELRVVPATDDERRFAVLDVSSKRIGDFAYFAAIKEQLDHGGLGAMLFDLLHYDLVDFDVRRVPATQALGDQILQGADSVAKWLHGVLDTGRIADFTEWSDATPRPSASKSGAHAAYVSWCTKRRDVHQPEAPPQWSKRLQELLGNCVVSARPSGESGDRQRVFRFASLGDCRSAFETKMRRPGIEWSTDAPEPPDIFET